MYFWGNEAPHHTKKKENSIFHFFRFIFIILIYNIRLNYTILVLKSYSSQNILSRIGHDNQWMSVHHTYYQISYTSTSIFQTTQTSTVVEKKLKQLSRHMAYTLLTHIKINIHYYILNLNTTVYKNKELQNNAAIVFKTSSATGKKFKKDTLHRGGNIWNSFPTEYKDNWEYLTQCILSMITLSSFRMWRYIWRKYTVKKVV